MRSLLKFLGLAREERVDPVLGRAADAIVAALRALGLHAEAKSYGAHFVEIVASTSAKLITTPDNAEASGIALLLAGKYDPPTLVFEEINSLEPGLGSAMVEVALQGLENGPVTKVRVDDASPRRVDGKSFWERVAARHARFDWEITQGERQGQRLTADRRGADRAPP